jgi:hypothetical protein
MKKPSKQTREKMFRALAYGRVYVGLTSELKDQEVVEGLMNILRQELYK